MTDLDELLAEVAIRTDRSHHWTGNYKLTLSDPDLVKDLAAAVRVLRDRPCPHVETTDGSSHCTLAESANTAWAARAERLEDLLRQANEAFDECTGDYPKELVANDPWRAVPDRPDGTDNPTSDEPVLAYIYHGPDGDQTLDPTFVTIARRVTPTGGDDDV